MLPFKVLISELGVVIKCRGILLNFSPCSTFHLYLLHNRMYLPPFQPNFTRTNGHCLWTFTTVDLDMSPQVNCSVLHYPPTFSSLSLSLSLPLERVKLCFSHCQVQSFTPIQKNSLYLSKAVPRHAMKALGGEEV
jgi:hypothetical protein